MIIFPMLTGPDISRYSTYHDDIVLPQETTLNHAIGDINHHITAMSRSMGTTHSTWQPLSILAVTTDTDLSTLISLMVVIPRIISVLYVLTLPLLQPP